MSQQSIHLIALRQFDAKETGFVKHGADFWASLELAKELEGLRLAERYHETPPPLVVTPPDELVARILSRKVEGPAEFKEEPVEQDKAETVAKKPEVKRKPKRRVVSRRTARKGKK